jgi:hypothetical protein
MTFHFRILPKNGGLPTEVSNDTFLIGRGMLDVGSAA